MIKQEHDFDVEIAELLMSGGYLKPFEMDRTHALKRQTGIAITESIAKGNLVEARIVAGARDVLLAIKDRRLDKSQARNALYMIANSCMSLDEALDKLGQTGPVNPWARHLAALEDR